MSKETIKPILEREFKNNENHSPSITIRNDSDNCSLSIRSNRFNCPICNDATGRCATLINPISKLIDRVLCKKVLTSKKAEEANVTELGYQFLGTSELYNHGSYVPINPISIDIDSENKFYDRRNISIDWVEQQATSDIKDDNYLLLAEVATNAIPAIEVLAKKLGIVPHLCTRTESDFIRVYVKIDNLDADHATKIQRMAAFIFRKNLIVKPVKKAVIIQQSNHPAYSLDELEFRLEGVLTYGLSDIRWKFIEEWLEDQKNWEIINFSSEPDEYFQRKAGYKVKTQIKKEPSQNANKKYSGCYSQDELNKLSIHEQLDFFFSAIGRDNSRIYVRCLVGKNIPPEKALELGLAYVKKKDKEEDKEQIIFISIKGYLEKNEEDEYRFYERKFGKIIEHEWGIERLLEINKQGYGIYLIPNAGGDSDNDIYEASSFFWEIDDIPKDEQWKKIEELKQDGIEITAVVETDKSLHVYGRRCNSIANFIDDWKETQQQLIQTLNSDPSIHNPARLMRLPVFDHVKWDAEKENLIFRKVNLTYCNFDAPHYTDEDLDGILEPWDEKRWSKESKKSKNSKNYEHRDFSDEALDGYNIKNFAKYLIAGEVRPGGIHTYKCPAHNGNTNNSLHIFPNGAFKCHNLNCTPSDVWKAARDVAVANSYVMPERKRTLSTKKRIYLSSAFAKFLLKLSDWMRFLKLEIWKEERNQQHFNNWKDSKRNTPTITTNTEYFSYLIEPNPGQLSLLDENEKITPTYRITTPEENILMCIKSDLGSGKSTWAEKIIEHIREKYPDERWFAFGYINSLLRQQRTKWKKSGIDSRKFKLLQDEKAFGDIDKDKTDLALCIHSLKHFEQKLDVFDGCNIIIDEVVSVVESLLQDPNIKPDDRDWILFIFSQALKRAKRVFVLDGNLKDMVVKYLHLIVPEKKLITVENQFSRPKPTIEYLTGSINPEKQLKSAEQIKKNDNSPFVKALLNSPRFVLVSDNKTIILILSEILKGQGRNVLTVCSATNGDKDVKEFLSNPNDWIQRNWINKKLDGCILISPTGGSGLDISVKGYFTDLYGLFFGVIGVDAITQMIGRLRDNFAKFHIWVKERGEIKNLLGNFSREIQKNVRHFINYLQTIIWGDYEGNPARTIIEKFSKDLLTRADDIHFQMHCELMSLQLFEEWNLRDCVEEVLTNKGYELKKVQMDEDTTSTEIVKTKRQELYAQWSKEIFESRDLTEDEHKEIAAKFFQTQEEKFALRKHSLKNRLPGIEETEIWTPDFIQWVSFSDPYFLRHCEMLYLYQNPDLARLKAQTSWAAAMERESLRHFDLIKERYARIKALQNIKIDFFLNPGNKWSKDSPELVEAAKAAKQPNNKAALPNPPGKCLVSWMQNILTTLTYETEHTRIDSETREYKILLDEKIENHRKIILECLAGHQKFQNLAQKQNDHILRVKIAHNPCPTGFFGNSTLGSFGYNKTSAKWSLDSQESLSITKNEKHVDELEVVNGQSGVSTEEANRLVAVQEAQIIEVLPVPGAEPSNDIPAASTEGLQPQIEADEDINNLPENIRVAAAYGIAEEMIEKQAFNVGYFERCLKALKVRHDQVKELLTLHQLHMIRKYYSDAIARKNQRTG